MTATKDPWLSDVEATTRRVVTASGLATDPSVYGDLCVNDCGRYALSADRATCSHRPVCEDCWPNGCAECAAQLEADLRRRDVFVNTIAKAADAVEPATWDFPDSELRMLDWRQRKDLMNSAGRLMESLRRITDTLNAQDRGVTR